MQLIIARLIMTVVLVNISFILCQLAVDLSNILGYGLKEMFINMDDDTKIVTIGNFAGDIATALTSTHITTLAIVGLGAAAAFTWRFWLFPLLLFLPSFLPSTRKAASIE